MKPCLAALVVGLYLLHGTASPAQTQRALLIAINTYEPEGTKAVHPHGCTYGRCNDEYFPNLDGSVNDAQSMADFRRPPNSTLRWPRQTRAVPRSLHPAWPRRTMC